MVCLDAGHIYDGRKCSNFLLFNKVFPFLAVCLFCDSRFWGIRKRRQPFSLRQAPWLLPLLFLRFPSAGYQHIRHFYFAYTYTLCKNYISSPMPCQLLIAQFTIFVYLLYLFIYPIYILYIFSISFHKSIKTRPLKDGIRGLSGAPWQITVFLFLFI